jgi:glycosyltransferase 2 family protein
MTQPTPDASTDARQSRVGFRTAWRIGQPVLLVLTLFYVARGLYLRWDDVQQAARTSDAEWGWIALSAAIVLATYAMLVESWRLIIRSSGASLRYGAAVQIWTAANLGRYLPGKVWSVGALGVLAQREGVPGWTAAGAALIGTVLNLGAGFGIAILAATGSLDAMPGYLRVGAIVGSVLFVLGMMALPWLMPLLVALLTRLRRTDTPVTLPPVSVIWIVAIVNACAWLLYGIAFAFFARGATPGVVGTPMLFVAVFTASYLAGYLALFAPAGIGVREAALVGLLLAFDMATVGEANLLSLMSRLWLTVLEIVPGLIGLLLLAVRARATRLRASR